MNEEQQDVFILTASAGPVVLAQAVEQAEAATQPGAVDADSFDWVTPARKLALDGMDEGATSFEAAGVVFDLTGSSLEMAWSYLAPCGSVEEFAKVYYANGPVTGTVHFERVEDGTVAYFDGAAHL